MDAVRAYCALWSEQDPERQAELLRICWTEDSEIIGPGYHFKGAREVLEELARFQRDERGHRAVRTSNFDQHGTWIRFTIAVLDTAGQVVNQGWDIVELRPDLKIARVITFWGTLSSP
jgi:hypothetical protein